MNKDEVEKLNEAQKFALIINGNLFCWKTFFTGIAKKCVNFFFETILSAEFLVWAAFSIGFFFCIFLFKMYTEKWLWQIYLIISIVFVVAKSLRHVLENKTTIEIKAQATAAATAALTGNLAEMANTAIEKIKGDGK